MNVDEFAQVAARPDWFEEDQVGFHMDVDAALSAEAASFNWDFKPADTVKTMVFEIEWIGEGTTLSDIDRDFYRVCGRFAEQSQFISRVVASHHIRYEVVTGNSSHGHVATFKVGGERAGAIAKWVVANSAKSQ
jgi:hypothetical protein